VIERLNAHYGFAKTPFGKTLAPAMLHHHTSHNQAVARISWCIAQRGIGLIVGESGAGKTVAARAAIAAIDPTRHTLIYIANPTTGARGLCHHIVTSLGGVPRFQNAALFPQAADALAAENTERGRQPVLAIDLCRTRNYADIGEFRMRTSLPWW
jgi:type II secretory pathway predicted ATPase ExeA